MKRMAWIGIVGLGALVARAETRDAKEDVLAAAKKLAEAANYGWTSTPKSEGGGGGGQARMQPGPTEGKTEKDGFTVLSSKMGETITESVLKGDKIAIKTAEGWKSATELSGGGQQGQRNPAAFAARALRTFKAPAAQLENLAGKARELKSEGEGAYSSELTEEGAKELLTFGGRGGQNAPAVAEPKGSLKVWLKDGLPTKFEYTVSGKVTFGQREIAINRTTTTEIKEVGSTKVEVPEEAKAKLQ